MYRKRLVANGLQEDFALLNSKYLGEQGWSPVDVLVNSLEMQRTKEGKSERLHREHTLPPQQLTWTVTKMSDSQISHANSIA